MTGQHRPTIRSTIAIAVAPWMAWAMPAAAEEANDERPYCAARPGLGTTPCTIAPRRVSVEIALADWQRDNHGDQHADTMLLGGLATRIGMTNDSELSVEWTPYGATWVAGSGVPTLRGKGTGDLTVSTKINLRHPDGDGLSIAVQPFLGLPIGGTALGSGHVATGVTMPVSYALGGPFTLQATSQLTLEPGDDAGPARLSGRMIGGVGVALTDRISATGEISVSRGQQDGAVVNSCLAAASVAMMISKKAQVDVGSAIGINRHSPAMRFYIGISRII